MAWSLVQQQQARGNSGSTLSVTLTATTAGNLLVMFLDGDNNPGDVTFTPPANWVQAGTTVHDDIFIAISGAMYYYPNCPAGITTVAVTASGTMQAWHIKVCEFSGGATTSPLDGSAIRTQSATTTPSSGAITTTAAGDLVIGFQTEDDVNGAYTFTQAAGYTSLTSIQDVNAFATLRGGYQTQAAAGSINYNPTLSSTATDSVIGIMAFKAAGGGGGTVNGSGNEIANSVLAQTSAELVNASAPVQANSAATQAAQIVNASAPTQSNSALAETAAQIITHGDTLQSNSAVASQPAQLVNPSAAVQATSVLSVTGHIETPPPELISNSTLAVTAQIITAATPVVSNAAITQAAQIITALVAVAANSVLVATGASQGQSIPGSVALTDALAHVVTISDALAHVVTLTDALAATVTISDSPAEGSRV